MLTARDLMALVTGRIKHASKQNQYVWIRTTRVAVTISTGYFKTENTSQS